MRYLPLALILFLVLPCASLRAADADAGDAGKAPPAGGTLILQLSGSFPLRPPTLFFEDHTVSLYQATMDLREALADPAPRLVLDLSNGFAPSLAAAEELAAVLSARKPGKHVVALVDNLGNAGQVVAAACDEVVMTQAGLLSINGISASTDYYADTLARIGVKFHAVTSGPAKSAPEPLTRNGPSPAATAEHEHLVHALDDILVAGSVRPGLDANAVRAARLVAPQTATIAMSTHLVDSAVEPGNFLRTQPAPMRYFRSTSEHPDVSSLSGLLEAWKTLLQGEQQPRFPQMVAVVELEGTIVEGDVSNPGYTIAGNDTARLFDRLAGDNQVVAVVVRVNSGGGSAEASDRIHYAIRRCAEAKPVVALYDTVAASGGYYLGCAAREIMVHHGTITGSIGVFALVPDLEGTRDLLGIHRVTIATGPRADLFATGAFTPEKEAALRQVIEMVDSRFQHIVAERRKLPPATVATLAGGKVYTGDQAIALGLADTTGDLISAVARARELAGISTPLPIERLPRNEGLAGRFGLGATDASIASLSALTGLALPAELRLWLGLLKADHPLIMAWSTPLDVQ